MHISPLGKLSCEYHLADLPLSDNISNIFSLFIYKPKIQKPPLLF